MTNGAMISAAARFWPKVQKSAGCWLWTASTLGKGYGQFWAFGRKVSAHRFSYVLHVGPVPPGMELDHLCRNILCVRPDHLEPVSPRENQRRGLGSFALTGRCRTGRHEISDDSDFYTASDGKRSCQACKTLARRAYNARQAAKEAT